MHEVRLESILLLDACLFEQRWVTQTTVYRGNVTRTATVASTGNEHVVVHTG